MRCAKCNAKLTSHHLYCPRCGEKVNREVPVSQGQKANGQLSERAKLGLVIIICVCVVILWTIMLLCWKSRQSVRGRSYSSTNQETQSLPEEQEQPSLKKIKEEPASAADILEKMKLDSIQKEKFQEAIQIELGQYKVMLIDECSREGSHYHVKGIMGEIKGNGYVDSKMALFSAEIEDSISDICVKKIAVEKEYRELSFDRAAASSVCPDQVGNTYVAQNTVDQNNQTAWIEGAKGNGENEYIKLTSTKQPKMVYGICIKNGYIKNDMTKVINNRIKGLNVQFSQGQSKKYILNAYEVPDDCYSDWIMFDEPIATEYVKLSIGSIYKGADYYNPKTKKYVTACEDTCITEIRVLTD